MEQLIHFRLGGKQRHCSILAFGYLTGMLSADEMREYWIREFMANGLFDTSQFKWDHMTVPEYWLFISGGIEFRGGDNKATDIRNKRLRVLHKMINNSFLHRGSSNDKVFHDELWLLRHFAQGNPRYYVLAPYILALHMSTHSERRLVCGHFVAMIMERLNSTDKLEDERNRGNAIQCQVMGRNDFVRARLLSADRSRLLGDDEAPPPPARQKRRIAVEEEHDEEEPEDQPQPEPRTYDFSDLSASVRAMAEEQHTYHLAQRRFYERYDEDQRWMGSQMGYLSYHQQRYQPMLESSFQGRPYVPVPEPPVYQPPDLFIPFHRQGGGFWYPPRQQAPPPEPGFTGVPPVSFGTFAGTAGASTAGTSTAGASGSGSGDQGRSFVDSLFYGLPGQGGDGDGDGTPSTYPPP